MLPLMSDKTLGGIEDEYCNACKYLMSLGQRCGVAKAWLVAFGFEELGMLTGPVRDCQRNENSVRPQRSCTGTGAASAGWAAGSGEERKEERHGVT